MPAMTRDGPWARYRLDASAPWDLRRVVHLHRRAGFAATWEELRRDLKDGPDKSIDRVLAGTARLGIPDDFARTANLLRDEALRHNGRTGIDRLRGWWVYRMLWGSDPLGEKMALTWHDHFATAAGKVDYTTATWRQNELLRRHGRGRFGELLRAVVRDPALLIWLDAPTNRKGKPNENLARELMELFTLGVGHYTEGDVKEAARALTGWTVVQDAFQEKPGDHDAGEKTILGRTGRWTGDDLVRALLDHPATARRVAWRVCGLLMGEGGVDEPALDALAAGLRDHDLDVGWAVETVLRSRAFHDPKNLGTRVLGPVEYVLGAARALGQSDPPPSGMVLAEWSARLGQDLFNPPNVGGWKGGRDWLSPRAIVGRANYAAALVEGTLCRPPARFDWGTLASRHGQGKNPAEVLAFAGKLLTGAAPGPAWQKRLEAALGPRPDPARAVALVVASPEAQLG